MDDGALGRRLSGPTDAPLTADLIESLSDDDLDDRVWLRLATRVPLRNKASMEVLPAAARAYYATRVFEWEVGNGGLYQYFLNFEDKPWFLRIVLEGYDALGLGATRRLIEETIVPAAMSESERRLRAAERRPPFPSHAEESLLADYDGLIEDNTDVRLRVVRSVPDDFVG